MYLLSERVVGTYAILKNGITNITFISHSNMAKCVIMPFEGEVQNTLKRKQLFLNEQEYISTKCGHVAQVINSHHLMVLFREAFSIESSRFNLARRTLTKWTD